LGQLLVVLFKGFHSLPFCNQNWSLIQQPTYEGVVLRHNLLDLGSDVVTAGYQPL